MLQPIKMCFLRINHLRNFQGDKNGISKTLIQKSGKCENLRAGSSTAINAATDNRLNQLADAQKPQESLTDETLLKTFAEYFEPNKQFYSVPGSPLLIAYFQAVNAARTEMLQNPLLDQEATKRSQADLLEIINRPMLVCGLIFHMGQYAAIQDAVLCVDFSEKSPIALLFISC